MKLTTIGTVSAAALALSLTGCLGSGAKKIERDPNGTVIPQKVEVGSFRKKPQADVVGDTREVTDVKKVIVPFFKIQFNKNAGESATASTGGPLGSGPSANVHLRAKLGGVGEDVFARLTNATYDDLVTKLKAEGFDVVGLDSYKNGSVYSKLDANDFPDTGKKKSIHTASGLRNPGRFTFLKTWGKLMNDTGASIVTGEYLVNFAAFGTETSRGFGMGSSGMAERASAEVSLGQVAHVWGGLKGSTRGKCKRGECWGKQFNAGLGQATYSKISMGVFEDTTSGAVKGIQGVFNTMAALSGGSTRTDSEKTLNADPKKYEAAALEALKEANTRLVKKLKAADKS